MNVYWTDNAYEHLGAIYEHIARDSPHYARKMIDRLTRRSIQIGTFPSSGRMVPEYQDARIREVIEGAYRLIYLVQPDQIRVLAVVNAAQLLPPDL